MVSSIPIHSKDRWIINFIKKINPSFTPIQLENASRLCQGLITSMSHKSISAIASSLIDSRDQSSLNRFLNESDWGCDVISMDINKIKVMQQNRQTSFTSKGNIIIDDSLLEKSGSSMELVGKHFDHCSSTMKTGLSLVSMNYSDDKKNYNLLKDVYLRKKYLEDLGELGEFKTKIETAISLIETLIEIFPFILTQKPKFVFDSWFLAKSVVSTLKKYDLKYVSRAKSNRIIVGLEMNLKEYALNVLKESDFKMVKIQSSNKTQTRFIYTTILPLSNLGDVKISFIKNKLKEPVKLFIVSNDLKLSENELIKIYKERWCIETDYKNNKQYLGLSDFHLRKKEGILRYLTLCFLVSTYLEYCRLMGIFGHCFGKEIDLSSKGKEVRAYQHLLFERFVIWLDYQFSEGKNLQDLLKFFRDDNTQYKENIQFVQYSTHLSLEMSAV